MNPSPPNSPAPNRLVKGDAEADAFRRAEERVLLREQFAADLGKMHRDDLARIRRAEGDMFLARAAILKHGHEERFASEQSFARAHERAEKAAVLCGAVAEDGFHLDAVFHVHHPARFGHDGFLGSSSTSTNCMSSPKIL